MATIKKGKICHSNQQQQAFTALFETEQRICFQSKLDSGPVFLSYPFAGFSPDYQFFVLNPFQPDSTKRNQKDLLYRQGFTVEMDSGSLDFQRAYFKAVLECPTVTVFSGNKSIHHHCILTKPLAPEAETELIDLLKKAFPLSDWSMYTDGVKLCRVPGAVRDNGKEQTIEYIGKKLELAAVLATLRNYTKDILAIPQIFSSFVKALAAGKYQSRQDLLTGVKVGKCQLKSLGEALQDLVRCGYSLAKDSWEYLALSQIALIGDCLDNEIIKAREASTEKPMAEASTAKPAEAPTEKSKLGKCNDVQRAAHDAWLDEHLRSLDLVGVLVKYTRLQPGTVRNDPVVTGKYQLCCPYHNDHKPSAWIAPNDSNGVPMLHCSSDKCEVNSKSMTAVAVAMESGLSYRDAITDLFGYFPSFCDTCGQELFWDKPVDGRPFNDRELTQKHACDRKKQKAQQQRAEMIAELAAGKPQIVVIPGQLDSQVNQAEAALLQALAQKQCEIYQHSTLLAMPVVSKRKRLDEKDCGNSQLLAMVEKDHLTRLFSKVAVWVKKTKDGLVPADIPDKVASAYIASKNWQVPIIRGIIEAPTLRHDGSILDKQGYDEKTGLLFRSDYAFPPMPQAPTRDDAMQSLKIFQDLLKTFPFVEEKDFSVMLSAILTALVRPTLPSAPLHGFTATQAGTGKSLLADIISIIATGRHCCTVSQAKNQDEEKKELLSVLLESQRVVSFDNLTEPLKSPVLCTILSQETWSHRLLGRNQLVTVETSTMFLANGNALTIVGDMKRRSLLCRLNANCEHPEKREFKTNILNEVKERRGMLGIAALTILKAYIDAGRPIRKVKLGGYEDWSSSVRDAIIWLGLADPVLSQELLAESDPEKQALAALLQNWFEARKTAATCQDLLDFAKAKGVDEQDSDRRKALLGALVEYTNPKEELNARMIGNKLKSLVDTIESGYVLRKRGKNRDNFVLWQVEQVCGESAESVF